MELEMLRETLAVWKFQKKEGIKKKNKKSSGYLLLVLFNAFKEERDHEGFRVSGWNLFAAK